MADRKVINKYFPPDYDPTQRTRGAKRSSQHTVRLMAPFSMRCTSCGEFIYKGRKFNARKEDVHGPEGNYLGIKIFRFYIRCPCCGGEITYRTDPQHADYFCEQGAKRNFEPWREQKAEEERSATRKMLEELHNPMGALESRTYDSKREIETAETLDEIRLGKARLEQVDPDLVLLKRQEDEERKLEKERNSERTREEDEEIRLAFASRKRPMLEAKVTKRIATADLLLCSNKKPQKSSWDQLKF